MCAKIKLLLLFYTRIKSDPSLSEITLGSKFDQWANWSLPPVTVGYFFAMLVYQLATNFPSIQQDVNSAIRNNPALLDPDTPLCDQMEALFLQPLWKLRPRLCGCPPLSVIIDALDECTSEPELTDLILSLTRALHKPDLPVTHILLTSCLELHTCWSRGPLGRRSGRGEVRRGLERS